MNWLERRVVGLLKIPPPPAFVSDVSERTQAFRASPRYYRFKLIQWSFRQLSAAAGIVAFLWFTGLFDFDGVPPLLLEALAEQNVNWPKALLQERFAGRSILDGLFVLEIAGIAGFLLQLPVSYTMLRLDYKMRWYVLTDRSLHIRAGIRHVKEQTLTLANVQNVRLEQGPLERLFGYASVMVRTAGGGSSSDSSDDDPEKREAKALHIGWLRGVDNAEAVRDKVLGALRRHRDAGLGDTEDVGAIAPTQRDPALAAATELLQEVRLWRRAVANP